MGDNAIFWSYQLSGDHDVEGLKHGADDFYTEGFIKDTNKRKRSGMLAFKPYQNAF